jgi:hypothetical protein
MCKSMDEQISTCMAWIWSYMCLTLLCTSTQSSHLKWVSGGSINSPRQPKSCWLKVVETYTIGWTDAPLFIGIGSSGASPRHVTVEICWRNLSGAYTGGVSVHPVLKNLSSKCLCMKWTQPSDKPQSGPFWPSVHPVLKLLQLAALCLDFLTHRID